MAYKWQMDQLRFVIELNVINYTFHLLTIFVIDIFHICVIVYVIENF